MEEQAKSESPLRLGISPCPNDTYIFENLVNSPKMLQFSTEFLDVQSLNEGAMCGDFDVVKVSCGSLPALLDEYRILSCGGAMGYNCGPLLLGGTSAEVERIGTSGVCLPGKNTTAALLFRFWQKYEFASLEIPKEYAFFDEVYEKLLQKELDFGVVIHENRFTWERDGLSLIQDLGAFWEEKTLSPVPLGVILIRKSLGVEKAKQVEEEIRISIEAADARKAKGEHITEFIRSHAQEMDIAVMQKHIDTFVNEFSHDIGVKGRKAIEVLLEISSQNRAN